MDTAAREGHTRRYRRVGLLGGSFDPPHEGHLFISLQAIRLLRLDELWWLVATHNPLKNDPHMTLQQRVSHARCMTKNHKKIVVSDLEYRYNLRSSYETICFLQHRYRRGGCVLRFVWVMGADCLVSLPLWHRWSLFVKRVSIAVFARGADDYRALGGMVAKRVAYARRSHRVSHKLAVMNPPAWVFFSTKKMPQASRLLRKRS